MRNRLSFRLAAPVVVGVFLLWGFVTFSLMVTVENIAASHANQQLRGFASEAEGIFQEARQMALAPARPDVRPDAKLLATSRLERLFRALDVAALVLDEEGSPVLRVSPPGLSPLSTRIAAVNQAVALEQDGRPGFAYEFTYAPWKWRVIMADFSPEFERLTGRIRDISFWAGALLLAALTGYLRFSRRTVSRPVACINRALNRGDKPEYSGIEEFTSLAQSIGSMMDSLEERERQVRVSRTWYRQMFESAPVMMFTLASNGWFSDVNRRLCEHSGHTRERLINMPATELIVIAPKRLEELWSGMALTQVPAELRTADNGLRQVLVDALLTEDPEGRRVVLAVVNDVTDQLRTERELIAARDAAEAANRAKSEFLANVSHEIRTPLNGLLGMLQLLEKSSLDERQGNWVKNALDCGRSLFTLLGDILDFSALESGGAHLAEEPFAPGGILAEIAELFARQALAKSLQLEVSGVADVPRTVLGDGGRLRQVLFNIVGNAIKFTQWGSVQLGVECLGQSEDGRLMLRFSVADTGIGIGQDKLASIFEPFTQADGSHTRRYQGAGLGLAIVKRLVDMWGGELEMHSEPEQGTTVRFTMPARPAPAGVEAPLAAPASPEPPTRTGRVLLAEDDPINTVMTMDMLESLGYSATIVENGSEAIKALLQDDFDCLLMDIQMPEMDGITATRTIREARELGEKASIPIIALTAHALPGDRERFLAAGMNDYLAKPVEFDHLEMVLARAMGDPKRHRLS